MSGGGGQGAPGEGPPAPSTAVVVGQLPLRVLPASADRPKPDKPILRRRVGAALPVPDTVVSPPRPRRPVAGRAVLAKRAPVAGKAAAVAAAEAAADNAQDFSSNSDELRTVTSQARKKGPTAAAPVTFSAAESTQADPACVRSSQALRRRQRQALQSWSSTTTTKASPQARAYVTGRPSTPIIRGQVRTMPGSAKDRRD